MMTLLLSTDAPTVRGPIQGMWTYADWETLPHQDGNIYEIIQGVLYVTTAPSFFHNWIANRLYWYLGGPAQERGLGFAIMAPTGVLMPNCAPVQPDFLFVRAERAGIIRERRVFGPPDLIVEILSPNNRAYDEETKFVMYAAAGVPEYGLLDPISRSLRLHRLAGDAYGPAQVFTGQDMVRFDAMPGVEAALNLLFEGSPDTTL